MKKAGLLATAALVVGSLSQTAHANVMFQGFYWDTPTGWYNTMANNAAGLQNMAGGYGINRMYFPPPSKADGGGYSMGYNPFDYYDVGNYNQLGTTNTRFGSKANLTNATTQYRNRGVVTMVDTVLNHRSGGQSEWNPTAGYNTWTNFTGVASGQMKWRHGQFHPNIGAWSDPGVFGGYPDVSHTTGNNAGQPYYDQRTWGNWLKVNANAGFNGGFRQDYVKGIHNWYINDFRAGTSSYNIGEYWDSNTQILNDWCSSTGASAFDFATHYTVANICNNTGGGGWMPDLINTTKSFAARWPARAVPFVGNHDTDAVTNQKMLAYAHIVTYQGYPCIWWKDYFDYGLASLGGQWGNGIKQLVWARNRLDGGGPNIQVLRGNDGDTLIYGNWNGHSGAPGTITVINDHPSAWRGYWVQTGNTFLRNKTLKSYAWYSHVSGQNYQPANKFCDGSGWVEVWAPPRGYAVYSANGY